jgi:hypothetical protein
MAPPPRLGQRQRVRLPTVTTPLGQQQQQQKMKKKIPTRDSAWPVHLQGKEERHSQQQVRCWVPPQRVRRRQRKEAVHSRATLSVAKDAAAEEAEVEAEGEERAWAATLLPLLPQEGSTLVRRAHRSIPCPGAAMWPFRRQAQGLQTCARR